MKKKHLRFPSRIVVVIDGSPGQEFLAIEHGGVDNIEDDGREVAIYERVDIGRVDVKRTFVSKDRRIA